MAAQSPTIFRHSMWVRLTHWIGVISLAILFMSGLQIFNAHPSLSFGQTTTIDKSLNGLNRLILDIDQDFATGRRWHLLFAWILLFNCLVYLAHCMVSRHISRDLIPRVCVWRAIQDDVVQHLDLRFNHGPDAPQYNALQKIPYALILFVVLPILGSPVSRGHRAWKHFILGFVTCLADRAHKPFISFLLGRSSPSSSSM